MVTWFYWLGSCQVVVWGLIALAPLSYPAYNMWEKHHGIALKIQWKQAEKWDKQSKTVFNIHTAAGLQRADIDSGVNGGFINSFSLTAFSRWAVPCCVVKLTYLSEAISHWRLHWPEPLLDYRVTLAWLQPGRLASSCDGANVSNTDKEGLLVCMFMSVCRT